MSFFNISKSLSSFTRDDDVTVLTHVPPTVGTWVVMGPGSGCDDGHTYTCSSVLRYGG